MEYGFKYYILMFEHYDYDLYISNYKKINKSFC